ncbi:3',5'-cyclic-AMP phosphodiesterase, partial [Litorivivens sp.]
MKPTRITQLSDTHLGKLPGYELLGLDTDYSFSQVLRLAESMPAPELYLLSGDISNNGYREAYQRVYDVFAQRDNVVWLPGNHDNVPAMKAICDERWFRPRVDLGAWQLLSLDSSVPGTPCGTLGDDQLVFLDEQLKQHRDQYTLVALHHHVLPVGCEWLDEQVLSNSEELTEVLSRYPQVKAVTSGHVHQEMDTVRDGIRFITSPSTCVQFARSSPGFLVSDEAPGLRWFELFDDGSLKTGVERVLDVPFSIDLA